MKFDFLAEVKKDQIYETTIKLLACLRLKFELEFKTLSNDKSFRKLKVFMNSPKLPEKLT